MANSSLHEISEFNLNVGNDHVSYSLLRLTHYLLSKVNSNRYKNNKIGDRDVRKISRIA